MGTTKTEEFTIKDNKIAKYAKALAHPARVAILQLLIKTSVGLFLFRVGCHNLAAFGHFAAKLLSALTLLPTQNGQLRCPAFRDGRNSWRWG